MSQSPVDLLEYVRKKTEREDDQIRPDDSGHEEPSNGRECLYHLRDRLQPLEDGMKELVRCLARDDPSEETLVAARHIVEAWNPILDAVLALIKPMYREPRKALHHGVAMGFDLAGRLDLLYSVPRSIDDLWTFPVEDTRKRLLKAAGEQGLL